ncbi:hypothetical protein [Edaphobacter dinghuensis]|uniref:Uncharacterized protein n=1 Tax=Edaphobacter dinghuensis TaxID=1560005 RepID=A0A917M0S0_9BACT|nr:hypothetical protein [Edaphobacter dinghuensis]GGG67857.1 hypothetical protein GCM10011585_07220 [Edaphobacter dinghuensis]
MTFQPPTILDIDRSLRDDFRRRVKDFGISVDATDPVLAVLFRTFAQQIETVYADTGRMRQSLLDELMAGLQLSQRLAHPAQTVVRFTSRSHRAKVLRAGTELNAKASTGERLTFGLDATIQVSAARIALALAYQDQQLQLLPGVETAESLQPYRPSIDPVKVNLGVQPALLIAIENLPPTLLRRHALFFELGPGSFLLREALRKEPWWIFNEDGTLDGTGLMRPRRANSGVYELGWQLEADWTAKSERELPEIPDGFYSGRQFIFPDMSEDRRLLCQVPKFLDGALAKICGRDMSNFLSTPRVWIKIPLPPGIPALRNAVNGIMLHAMTASNVFCRNQTVQFERDGRSIPVGHNSVGVREMLVAPLSVSSLANEPYEAGLRPRRDASVGWYELHNDRLTLHPGIDPNGQAQTAANVRLWLTNGSLGNRVGPGDITGFAHSATFDDISVSHVTAAAGGTNGDDYPSTQRRFAEALLSRGRIVTRADLEASTLSFDRRILAVEVRSQIERQPEGLRRMERLWVTLDEDGFTEPEVELPVLQQGLESYLKQRLIQGILLEVRFEWSGGTAP